ncbi:hypothetical protein DPMN_121125 [Dreissena polymorpha]|uniref:Uncharacterized protein n=1 Tax=Dreissena polymorpha TaxID=45954 RepID=A0A9D4GSY6_DREPO|nr:hypothetical protein DPMN_121125 [Dreissena polymorpha]
MMDSLSGPSRVNKMLSTLNLKTISDTNLKIMEQPAGEVIEQVATESARIAASDAIINEITKGAPAGYSNASVEVQSGSQFATYVTPTVMDDIGVNEEIVSLRRHVSLLMDILESIRPDGWPFTQFTFGSQIEGTTTVGALCRVSGALRRVPGERRSVPMRPAQGAVCHPKKCI